MVSSSSLVRYRTWQSRSPGPPCQMKSAIGMAEMDARELAAITSEAYAGAQVPRVVVHEASHEKLGWQPQVAVAAPSINARSESLRCFSISFLRLSFLVGVRSMALLLVEWFTTSTSPPVAARARRAGRSHGWW